MKLCLILILIVLSFSCNMKKKSNGVMNGIMIDCARIMERQDYYFRLIDFMADWNMNTLILHFSDDHGLSVRLPGFEKLARSHAFTPQDINRLINYGMAKGIEIIPELEVFGHTRFITDHPDYQHLYVGEKTDKISFNAINPLETETIVLMESMIGEVAAMFPSKYIHLGCDEVDLDVLCKSKGLNESIVWTDYVNKMVDIAQKNGKKPIIWNDHLRKNGQIAKNLSKQVVLMEWNYDPGYEPSGLNELYEMGYNQIIMAPSIACYRLRVLPSKPGLINTQVMAEVVRNKKAKGLINTMWLPMRYIQNAMWYGIAYSGYLTGCDKKNNLRAFHEKFAEKVFDKPLTDDLDHYLTNWTNLHLDYKFYISMAKGEFDFSASPEKMGSIKKVNLLSKQLLDKSPKYIPGRNEEILESMILATKVFFVISEGLLILSDQSSSVQRQASWRQELKKVKEALDAEWNKGRYADDPNKYKAKFSNQEHSHLLIILEKLSKASAQYKMNNHILPIH